MPTRRSLWARKSIARKQLRVAVVIGKVVEEQGLGPEQIAVAYDEKPHVAGLLPAGQHSKPICSTLIW